MSANPFSDDRHADDPFNDPVIANALASSALQPDAQSEDDEDDYGRAHPYRPGPSQPLAIPSDDPSDKSGLPLTERERELRRREAELLERERRLEREQEEMRLHGGGLRPPNFPPIYPFMYHDIDVEIPEAERQTMRHLFYSWLAVPATLVLNAVACFLILISHATGVTTGGADFGAAIVYCVTITVGSFLLWYRPIYNAYMKERSLYYYFYFVFNGFHIAFQYYMTVGIPGSGSAGLINTISMLSDGKIVAGTFGLMASALWAAGGTASLYLYKRVHSHYRLQGHTFADAKGDALASVATSDLGRRAAGSYVASQV